MDSTTTAFRKSLSSFQDSLTILKHTLRHDSLKSDSLQEWYRRQQNRIKHFPQSKKEKQHQLDTLRTSFEKKKTALNEEREAHLENVQQARKKMETRVAGWKQKLKSGLSPLDSLSGDAGSTLNEKAISGLPPQQTDIPELKTPNLKLPATDPLALPNAELGDFSQASLPNAEIPSLDGLQQNISIPELEQFEKGLKEVKELEQHSASLKKYKTGIDSLEREQAEKLIENEVTQQVKNVDEVKALDQGKSLSEAEIEKIRAYERMVKQYQDKDYIEKQMEQKSKTLANDVIAKNAPQVKDAQKRIVKNQKKYKQFSSLSEAKKHPFNSLRGKPFHERFYYGLSLQIQKKDYQQVFFSPQAYYRITGRLTAGIGFSYRVQYDTKPEYEWITENKLSGGKLFAKIGIAKGFFAHAEYEKLWVKNKIELQNSQRWMTGLGRSFRLHKKVKGEALILYNLSHNSDAIYSNQINIRTGFFFGGLM